MKSAWLLALWLAGGMFPAARGQAVQHVMLGSGEWEPLSSETMPGQGIVSEIVRSAFSAMGVKTTLRFFPWKRCEAALKAGEVDAIFPYRRTDERLEQYRFSSGILATRSVLFYLKGAFDPTQYRTLEDLRPYRIGGMTGSWYEQDFRAAGIPVDYVNSYEQNLEKLLARRIDVAMLTDVNGWYLIQNRFPADYARFGAVAYHYPGHPPGEQELMNCLIVWKQSKGGRALLDTFNAGLRRIKENGTFAAILARHGLKTAR